MRYHYVIDKNFEDIFQVSAKQEQWNFVEHHIFDMVNNYVAIVNSEYLPMPFLVDDNGEYIGFVQINYYKEECILEIAKLIVHETVQGKEYGKRIVQDIITWSKQKYGDIKIKTSYLIRNKPADKLAEKIGFDKKQDGDYINAWIDNPIWNAKGDGVGQFDECRFDMIEDFVEYLSKTKRIPELMIGNRNDVNFRRVTQEYAEIMKKMELYESQEDFVMPFIDSMAQSYSDLFEDEITVTYTICYKDNPIGLLEIEYMKGTDYPDLKEEMVYELFRIIVDKKYQGKGYGLKASNLFLEYVKTMPMGMSDRIVVSVVEGNKAALNLYKKLGFEKIGINKYNQIALRKNI